ncbi:MAG: hypothetical protein ABFD97_05980 [Syntrophobacter sp.]
MINSNGSEWKIEHCCPQCGAPVVLRETDRIFVCSFCRVRLYIWSGDRFRYFLTPPGQISEPLIFVPYWRLKGIVYSLEGTEIKSGIIDSTLLATAHVPLPPSLGVRPQVLALRYVTPETPGGFLAPDIPFGTLASREFTAPDRGGCPGETDHVHFRSFIGDVVSLVFAPVIVRENSLFDAVLQKPLGAVPEPVREHLIQTETRQTGGPDHDPYNRIDFLATLCPQCGWDMEGERDSLVLYCRNCNSAWQAQDRALSKIGFSFFPNERGSKLYVPFWRLRVNISGLPLNTYTDLFRIANLPGVPKTREDSELHFWVPAFKSQPNLFVRLARSLTILQREPPPDSDPGDLPLFPVTLPLVEALESIKILIASVAVPKRLIFPRIPKLQLTLRDHALAYLPFCERGEEYIQPTIQMSIQKNALKWGRLI